VTSNQNLLTLHIPLDAQNPKNNNGKTAAKNTLSVSIRKQADRLFSIRYGDF
jgi:hypothetical protein